MANLDKVAASYAKAIFDFLGADGKVDKVAAELAEFGHLVAGHSELTYVLNTDVFSNVQRMHVISDLCTKVELSSETRRVLDVLSEKRRLNQTAHIAQKLKVLQLGAANVVPLNVESANHLDDGEKQKVEQRFAKILGKKVEASYRIEPSLMGGLRVTAAGRTYDGSLSGMLESFREKLVGGNI